MNKAIFDEKMNELKRSVSIVDYGERYLGFTPIKARTKYFSFKEHTSVMVDVNKNIFYRNSSFKKGVSSGNHAAGTILDFIMHFEGLSLPEASKRLLEVGGEGLSTTTQKYYEKFSNEPVEFKLPKKDYKRNSDAYHYLVNKRKIDPDVFKYLVKNNYLYQQFGKFRNAVFIGYNDDKKPVFALRQSTSGKNLKLDVAGSNYDRCFFINNHSNILIVTEAIIDTCSIMTLLKKDGKNFNNYNHLGLAGTNKIEALFKILEAFPNITEVWLGFDNDTPDSNGVKAGEEAKNIAIDTIKSMGIPINIKDITVNDYPNARIKDYNDLLKYVVSPECDKKGIILPFDRK